MEKMFHCKDQVSKKSGKKLQKVVKIEKKSYCYKNILSFLMIFSLLKKTFLAFAKSAFAV